MIEIMLTLDDKIILMDQAGKFLAKNETFLPFLMDTSKMKHFKSVKEARNYILDKMVRVYDLKTHKYI